MYHCIFRLVRRVYDWRFLSRSIGHLRCMKNGGLISLSGERNCWLMGRSMPTAKGATAYESIAQNNCSISRGKGQNGESRGAEKPKKANKTKHSNPPPSICQSDNLVHLYPTLNLNTSSQATIDVSPPISPLNSRDVGPRRCAPSTKAPFPLPLVIPLEMTLGRFLPSLPLA